MRQHPWTTTAWIVGLVIVGTGLTLLTVFGESIQIHAMLGPVGLFLVVAAMAFIAEYVDSSLGMGYGTTLTPILLLLGYSPLQVVPAVLVSEFATGVAAGGLHHRLGNVDFGRHTPASRAMWLLAACSIVGTVAAVLLAVKLPGEVVKLYIGAMILAIGVVLIFVRRLVATYSWRRLMGLGTVAAFNKGISGGGYGPLVTTGQILSGVPEKHAVAITSLAEGLVCLVGIGLYVVTTGVPAWTLAIPLTLGGLLSVPAATWTVRILPPAILRQSIGYATAFLGALMLLKVLL